MHITTYSILPLTTSLVSISLGLLVLFNNIKSEINRTFFLSSLAVFIWLSCYATCYSTDNENLATILLNIGCAAVLFISPTYYHFTSVLCKKKHEKKIAIFLYYVLLLYIPVAFFTKYFHGGFYKYYFGYYIKAGPLYIYVIAIFMTIISRSLFQLLTTIKKDSLPPNQLIQIKYILLAFSISFLASIDFLPKYQIEIYPFGALFFLFWSIIISYAILKHRLLDVNIVIRKGLIYSLLIATLTISYLALIMTIEKLFQNFFGYQSIIISLIYATIIAVFFIPIKNKIQHIIDKAFYRGSPQEIAQENIFLRKEIADKERLRAVATLASGMAHEIKNPLTAVKTFTEYLPSKKNDPQFLDKFARIVSNEVGRIDNLVNQLLDFAKPAPLNLKNTDVEHLIEDTLMFLNNDFIKHNISIVKQFSSTDQHLLKIDHNQFKQALLNLFLNAIEAMPDGGELTIGITGSPSSPDILCISIQDTGHGIAPEDIKHIFDPFFSKKDSGTGLGLAITQGIIQEHGGKINVETQSGVGTKFTIEMPLNYA